MNKMKDFFLFVASFLLACAVTSLYIPSIHALTHCPFYAGGFRCELSAKIIKILESSFEILPVNLIAGPILALPALAIYYATSTYLIAQRKPCYTYFSLMTLLGFLNAVPYVWSSLPRYLEVIGGLGLFSLTGLLVACFDWRLRIRKYYKS